MIRLVTMYQTSFQAYIERLIEEYAAEHVRAGNWQASEAEEKARSQVNGLLPQGTATPDQYVLSALDAETGAEVGLIWFALEGRKSGHTHAFIYDFWIAEEQRRHGYGRQALQAAEGQAHALGAESIALHVFAHNLAARALYEQAGYAVTDLVMRKELAL
jgi:ribosomal protein S18 acetylase RimI-like enzyme